MLHWRVPNGNTNNGEVIYDHLPVIETRQYGDVKATALQTAAESAAKEPVPAATMGVGGGGQQDSTHPPGGSEPKTNDLSGCLIVS